MAPLDSPRKGKDPVAPTYRRKQVDAQFTWLTLGFMDIYGGYNMIYIYICKYIDYTIVFNSIHRVYNFLQTQ